MRDIAYIISLISTFPNSYWLEHPMSEDIPKNMQIVEEGCYW